MPVQRPITSALPEVIEEPNQEDDVNASRKFEKLKANMQDTDLDFNNRDTDTEKSPARHTVTSMNNPMGDTGTIRNNMNIID